MPPRFFNNFDLVEWGKASKKNGEKGHPLLTAQAQNKMNLGIGDIGGEGVSVYIGGGYQRRLIFPILNVFSRFSGTTLDELFSLFLRRLC